MANLDQFVGDRGATWAELERTARRGGQRAGASRTRRCAPARRVATARPSADLAVGAPAFPGRSASSRGSNSSRSADAAPCTTRRARAQTVREFVSHGYWRRIRERPVLLLFAFAVPCVPDAARGVLGVARPGAGQRARAEHVPVRDATAYVGPDLGLSVDEESSIAAEIFTNNIRVTFLAFAGGMLLGIGTLYVLLQNGLLLGVVAGLAIGAGNGRPFFELVLAHGVLELSCIVVAGLAGLRLASAIVDPGNRTRGDALRSEARAAVEIILGTMFWLVVAGLVEGFLTPAGKGLTTVLVVGFGLGALFWGLVFWRGAPSAPSVTAAPGP